MGNENSRQMNLDQQRKFYQNSTKSNNSNSNSLNSTVKSNNSVAPVAMLQQQQHQPETSGNEVEQLRISLKAAHNEIEAKNKKIEELQRELDKLKSVLDQTYDGGLDADLAGANSETTGTIVAQLLSRHKRMGVSAESSDQKSKQELIHCPKSEEVKAIIREAILQNMLLGKLDQSQLTEIIACMRQRHVVENCFVIREGDDGQELYVAQDGEFEVFKDDRLISRMGSSKCFGELALLYNCKRTASVKALKSCTLWVLDRSMFQTIMMKTGIEKQNDLRSFLDSVPLFKNLPDQKLAKITQLVEVQKFSEGQCIIREGEAANSFFIIRSGWVKVTQKVNNEEVDIREMTVGDYFGEKALIEEGNRTASIYAINGSATEVLCLYREVFLSLIGDLNELQSKEYDDMSRIKSYTTQNSQSQDELLNMEALKFEDVDVVCTLGMGGFGRVELVVTPMEQNKSFALKCMKKSYIVQTKQQDHVLSEKKILSECKSSYICKLYTTFHDKKYVYLLMEVCLGGELWTLLRDKINFDDIITRFSLACVLEALQYLHSRGIVYRDLKPENLLIGNSGYLKLCDFGFAKKIGLGKRTWTFCGTPEYVAPEIVLNRSHDFSADYWSIGILTFELLNGSPPFIANDPMKIYHMTLKGIEAANIHHNRKILPKASNFIQKMCRFHPIERLGCGKNGFDDIRNHKYFQGFDWDSFRMFSLKSPIEPKISGPRDVSHFDKFTMDKDVPPDEISGWDRGF